MAVLLAIDPGSVSGAVAVFNGDSVTVADLDVADRQVDAAAFAHLVGVWKPVVAVVEKVGTMPKQGVVSAFNFGKGCGIIQGVLSALQIPVHLVSPNTWKKDLKLLHGDKEVARAMAIRLYPGVRGLERKRDQGRAEALLIGHWYRHFYGKPAWRGKLWPAGRNEDDD